MRPARHSLLGLLLGSLCCASSAAGFSHVVQAGETLASISEDLYGNVQFEKLLATANELDLSGARPIVPGLRLEVPAPLHYRVESGDTWDALALELLGDRTRSVVLAIENHSSPWLTPDEGAQIIVPFNLKVIAKDGDDIVSIAYTFMGDRTKGWILDQYNHFNGRALKRGDVVLVPLTDIRLTELGKRAALQAAAEITSQGESAKRQVQTDVTNELPALIADVRGGRYVDAVSRAMQFLGRQELSSPQLATIHRQLLEAYVALDAEGLAIDSCRKWRQHDPRVVLDPVRLSPKLIQACKAGGAPSKADASPSARSGRANPKDGGQPSNEEP